MAKVRADQLLVERGLADTREKAKALIMAGSVFVAGQKLDKPGRTLEDGVKLELTAKLPYVSRGGLKLEAALRQFQIDPAGKTCLDIGASTGGFTDCLLQHGAAKVYAVDTGSGQLDWRLRNDPRVVAFENTNARHLDAKSIPEPVDLLVCDVSFISVTLVLPPAQAVLKPDAPMIILVKPQFEAGREQVGKGGIVRDPGVHRDVCARIEDFVNRNLGFKTALMDSPISGAEGNKEFLLHAWR